MNECDCIGTRGAEQYLLCVRWPAWIENVAVGVVVGHPSSKQETDRINSQKNTTKHGVRCCDDRLIYSVIVAEVVVVSCLLVTFFARVIVTGAVDEQSWITVQQDYIPIPPDNATRLAAIANSLINFHIQFFGH